MADRIPLQYISIVKKSLFLLHGPFEAIVAAVGISGVRNIRNIYLTYSFAATLIEFFERPY